MMATVPPQPDSNPDSAPAEPTQRPEEISPPQHDVDYPEPGGPQETPPPPD